MVNVKSLTKTINRFVDEKDFPSARRLIELNLKVLETLDYKENLSHNAREFLYIIQEEQGNNKLSRETLLWINELNSASNSFDITRLRLLTKGRAALLEDKEIQKHLTDITKNVLTGLHLN